MESLTQCRFNRIADRDGGMTIYPANGALRQSCARRCRYRKYVPSRR